MLLYATVALRQPEAVTVMFVGAAAFAALIMVLPDHSLLARVAATSICFVLFVSSRIEMRRLMLATAVLVWVLAATYFAKRLERLRQTLAGKITGSISDLWLIAMLTLLALEGYIVTGLLMVSATSWIPRAGKVKRWFALAYVLLGGWLIIAAKLDINLELRRWYLLGALAIGIAASLLASAQEVQQRENVDPQ